MYPSYRRNQFPNTKGRTQRVEGFGTTAGSEVDYLRQSTLAGFERTGALYAHYRRFTPDWNRGRCPACYLEHLPRSTDPECPICYGTGFDGGFSQPVVQWMLVEDRDQGWEITDTGFVTERKGKCQSPSIPVIRQFDILAKLQKKRGEWVTSERFFIDEPVSEKRVRDNFEILDDDVDDHLQVQTEVYGFDFTAVYLTENNLKEFLHMVYKVPFENVIWLADPTKLEGIR